MKNNWKRAEEILKKDGVVVLPTDTLYGIIGRALSKKAVKSIYKIKGRLENKPFIVLISSLNDLKIFGVDIPLLKGRGQSPKEFVFKPKVSVILPCKISKFKYLHRGENSIAFRMISPKNKNLHTLIQKVGPLVAPSANPEGLPVAKTTLEAKKYFNLNTKNKIDLYISSGRKEGKPSKLLKYENGEFIVLRN